MDTLDFIKFKTFTLQKITENDSVGLFLPTRVQKKKIKRHNNEITGYVTPPRVFQRILLFSSYLLKCLNSPFDNDYTCF